MHTKAVYRAAKALAGLGCAVLRFNFRGVGASEGAWDEGVGELDDFRAALDAMAERYPDSELWAAGFSFGSWSRSPLAPTDNRVSVLLGIAPPFDGTTSRPCATARSRSSSSTASVTSLSAEGDVRVLRAAARAEGTGRHRRRRPPVRRQGAGGRRRDRGSARDFKTADELRPHERRCHRFRGAHAPSARRRRARCGRHGPTTWRRSCIAEALGARRRSTPAEIDDVILGCAMPEAEQGLNVARIASLRAGVPVERVGGHRQSLLLVRPAGDRLRRRAHHARVRPTAIIAGGTESMSLVPMGGHKIAPNPSLVRQLSRTCI